MTLPGPLPGILPDSAAVTLNGHLSVAGCDLVAVAEQFGTPVYVYDEAAIRQRSRDFRDALRDRYRGESLVCYAAKAYCAPWLLRVLAEEGLGLDVVSGGELFVARASGFPAERIYVHGNNKGEDELRLAVEMGVRRVVVDNMDEVARLGRIAGALGREQTVLLRVTPGVEAHTHEYIKTGILDSKFGVGIANGAAEAAVRAIVRQPGLRLVGLHSHIGSQIFELEPYRETLRRLFRFAGPLWRELGLALREISPGGGFGMRYTADDDPVPAARIVETLANAATEAATEEGFADPLPAITIEPGRSIVGPAGVAVYRVGSVKEIPAVRTYVAVDGGMADNIRPTTYGAVYSALLANRAGEAPTGTFAIAGKYCESGDVLIRAAQLPAPRVGDLVAVPGSGAYTLSMASNYNLALRPPVVVVKDGQARLVRRRETYEDLVRAEL